MKLDVGCGFSQESIFGQKYPANPRGDVNVDIGKPEVSIPNFIRASAFHLPFKEEVFEEVYMLHLLEHLEEPAIAVREAYRVLRNGGRLTAKTPNKRSRDSYLDPDHKWHFTPKTFKQIFSQFAEVKIKGASGCWIPLKGNVKLWGKILQWIHASFGMSLQANCLKISKTSKILPNAA